MVLVTVDAGSVLKPGTSVIVRDALLFLALIYYYIISITSIQGLTKVLLSIAEAEIAVERCGSWTVSLIAVVARAGWAV